MVRWLQIEAEGATICFYDECLSWDFIVVFRVSQEFSSNASRKHTVPLRNSVMIPLGQQFSNFILYQKSLGSLLKYRFLGSNFKVCDSVGLEWDSIICISNSFLDDVNAAGTRRYFGTIPLEHTADRAPFAWVITSIHVDVANKIHVDGPVH